MKKLALTLLVFTLTSLPAMAEDSLQPLQDPFIIPNSINALGTMDAVDNLNRHVRELERKVEALEKKLTYVVNILKLKQENGK